MRKRDGVRDEGESSPLEKEGWVEITPRKRRWVRVHIDHEKNSDGVRVHHKKEHRGESSQ